MKKKIKYIFLAILSIIGLVYIFTSSNSIQKDLDNKVIKYEVQTHEYFNNAPKSNYYYINSIDELNKFYSIYSDELNIDTKYLKNNTIFIQVKQVSSGSIQMKLSSVVIENNNIKFVVNSRYPDVGTDDMAFWYLVAIIPNDMIEDLKLTGWILPSEIELKK